MLVAVILVSSGCIQNDQHTAEIEFDGLYDTESNYQVQLNVSGRSKLHEVGLYGPDGEEKETKSVILQSERNILNFELPSWTRGNYTAVLLEDGEEASSTTQYFEEDDVRTTGPAEGNPELRIEKVRQIDWKVSPGLARYVIEDASLEVENNLGRPVTIHGMQIGFSHPRSPVPATSSVAVSDNVLEPGSNVVSLPEDEIMFNQRWTDLGGSTVAVFHIVGKDYAGDERETIVGDRKQVTKPKFDTDQTTAQE